MSFLKGSDGGMLHLGLLSFWALYTKWYSEKHILETGSYFFLRRYVWETPTPFGLLEKANISQRKIYMNQGSGDVNRTKYENVL
ncbi:hypothetical protein B7P43_G04196 [Cryptotermes secundus]|uniref:Uncharacterized protein n=1 Tax=Cryptotermes secundus TaxID=105785 RepID=A0A2J7PY38_9NEOP|nr:hypothetical protein B7P43_G04196 [Cryptotermes secundus]